MSTTCFGFNNFIRVTCKFNWAIFKINFDAAYIKEFFFLNLFSFIVDIFDWSTYLPTIFHIHKKYLNMCVFFFFSQKSDGERMLVVLLLKVHRILRHNFLCNEKTLRSSVNIACHSSWYYACFRMVGSEIYARYVNTLKKKSNNSMHSLIIIRYRYFWNILKITECSHGKNQMNIIKTRQV